ncbi:methyltransferase [Brevundimonas sp. PAMC22021]|uniref:methyltransferase n=1 Tax=Brevundimonas sp. PAMC22021 TaxID=2861285 RepID=UPI001C62A177|nr:methyltransferase [Brevundimonas sp. PAMC22021]QYF87079.1 methyltransferase [Brevundimonas sp. PAMC22021]
MTEEALVSLLRELKAEDYRFIMPTPSTHGRVRRRRDAVDADVLRDVFGWSRPFRAEQMPEPLLHLMKQADVLRAAENDRLCATIRVSSVDERLHAHSAPTNDEDAVFLGPDSYRYVRLLHQELGRRPAIRSGLDVGAGAGVGALTLAASAPDARVQGSDINPKALRCLRANALAAGLDVEAVEGSGVAGTGAFDLICSNPPFIADDTGRTYRDGGEDLGAALALDWARQALPRLTDGGRFILYTGSAIVSGEDRVRDALQALANDADMTLAYEEIDPDIFGGTLSQPAYSEVERIAAVGAVITAG